MPSLSLPLYHRQIPLPDPCTSMTTLRIQPEVPSYTKTQTAALNMANLTVHNQIYGSFSTNKALAVSSGIASSHLTPTDIKSKTLTISCIEEGKVEWVSLQISINDSFEDVRALCMGALMMQDKRLEDIEIRWSYDGRLLDAVNTTDTLNMMAGQRGINGSRIDGLLVVFCADGSGDDFDPWKTKFWGW